MSRKLSHVADWAPDSPSPGQLKEFFDQIKCRRITHQSLQRFLRTGAVATTGEQLARSIMGDDIIFSEEIAERCGFSYSGEQIERFTQTIPPSNVLRWCKEHKFAIVAGPPKPMSLLDVRDLKPENFYSKTGGWYAEIKEQFSRQEKAETRWLGIRKEPVPDSVLKTWEEQCGLISKDEYVPSAAEISWFITKYYEVRGIRLFPGIYVRTSSLGSDGDHVHVGPFSAEGLNVNNYWDFPRSPYIGLSVSRKFQIDC